MSYEALKLQNDHYRLAIGPENNRIRWYRTIDNRVIRGFDVIVIIRRISQEKAGSLPGSFIKITSGAKATHLDDEQADNCFENALHDMVVVCFDCAIKLGTRKTQLQKTGGGKKDTGFLKGVEKRGKYRVTTRYSGY